MLLHKNKHTSGELGSVASGIVELLHVVGNNVTEKVRRVMKVGELVHADPVLPLQLL